MEYTKQACPQCGKTITVDDRFVRWCEHCEWGIESDADKPESASSRKRAEAARARGERLFAELEKRPMSKPALSGEGVAAFAIAIAIHAITIGVFVLGLYVVVANFPSFFGFFVGGLLILVALLIRPRLGGIERGTVLLPRTEAPKLYQVCDRMAHALGAKPVDLIAFDMDFNAAHGQVGLRRRRVLWLGLPMWNVLPNEQRLALLGHELAHQVNGDLSYGLVVGSSLGTLAAWHSTLRPGAWRPGSGDIFGFFDSLGQLLARGLYRVLRRLVGVLYDFEEGLLFRSRQRAEYYADRVAGQAAESGSMLRSLDWLHLARPCSLSILYAARREEPDIWLSERNFVRDFSPKEWERLRRLDARRGTAVDSTHPPTHLRIEMLRAGPNEKGVVEVADSEWQAIDAEMSDVYRLAAEQLSSRYSV